MTTGAVLMKYLCREFIIKFLIFTLVLLGVVYLFDTIELIKRAADHDIGLWSVLALSLYKLPDVGQQILPFITLFTTMATLWSLSQTKELETIRAAGLSVWQFLLPMILAVFVIGLLFLNLLHPLTAASLSRFENLQNMYFGDGKKTVSIIDDGLWLRQEDETGNFILRAAKVNAKTWELSNASVYFFDNNNQHTQRLDAKTARLDSNAWIFQDVRVQQIDGTFKTLNKLQLSTSLTQDTISESFSNPQTISFWRLPQFIKSLEKTGLDTTAMKIYYQNLLVQPLFLISMVLLAAATSLRTSRFTKLLPVVVLGLGMGFAVFFFAGFLRALGAGHEIPIFMAIWIPPTIIVLCATATLIALEDG